MQQCAGAGEEGSGVAVRRWWWWWRMIDKTPRRRFMQDALPPSRAPEYLATGQSRATAGSRRSQRALHCRSETFCSSSPVHSHPLPLSPPASQEGVVMAAAPAPQAHTTTAKLVHATGVSATPAHERTSPSSPGLAAGISLIWPAGQRRPPHTSRDGRSPLLSPGPLHRQAALPRTPV